MKRRKIVAGNWKMNLDRRGAIELAETLAAAKAEWKEEVVAMVAPSFVHLPYVVQAFYEHPEVTVLAQNCHEADAGAFTGEVSAEMLHSHEVDGVILGHSERRQYFGETDELLAKKVKSALFHELLVVFCIGETLEERKSGNHFAVVERQLRQGLFHLDPEAWSNIILAYEPVWAIGTGETASPAQAQEMHAFIRKTIAEAYGEDLANSTSILYGGSCNPKNASDLFANPDVDGGLIGGASLKAEDFISILKQR